MNTPSVTAACLPAGAPDACLGMTHDQLAAWIRRETADMAPHEIEALAGYIFARQRLRDSDSHRSRS